MLGDLFGSISGDIISTAANLWASGKDREANRDISREQMNFQERMSSTAYQRAMADMKKAGLNPMLAMGQGGASSPPGASIPSVSRAKGVVSSAVQLATIKNINAKTRLTNKQAEVLGPLSTSMGAIDEVAKDAASSAVKLYRDLGELRSRKSPSWFRALKHQKGKGRKKIKPKVRKKYQYRRYGPGTHRDIVDVLGD